MPRRLRSDASFGLAAIASRYAAIAPAQFCRATSTSAFCSVSAVVAPFACAGRSAAVAEAAARTAAASTAIALVLIASSSFAPDRCCRAGARGYALLRRRELREARVRDDGLERRVR